MIILSLFNCPTHCTIELQDCKYFIFEFLNVFPNRHYSRCRLKVKCKGRKSSPSELVFCGPLLPGRQPTLKSVDYTLLSLSYNEYDESFWNFATNYMKFRYEYPVQSFHLANIFHDVYGDERNDRERLVYVNQKKVDEKIKTFARKDLFNLNNEEAFIIIIDEIINYLSN